MCEPAFTPTPTHGLSGDFWKFWTGQAISNLGSSFTGFALPLSELGLTDLLERALREAGVTL
jgi:hypothetical protein